jgi:hypothetical protein
MFVVTSKKSGGVYAINGQNTSKSKTVLIFEDNDDAVRYVELLDANGFDDELEVTEIEEEIIIRNCDTFDYDYAIIDKNNFVVPLNYDHL